jgi:hypothetical protein
LYEFCEVEGRLFLVTPYILSGTLAQRLQAGSCQRLRCVNASPRWCGRQRISIGGVLFTATSSPAIFYALAPAAAPSLSINRIAIPQRSIVFLPPVDVEITLDVRMQREAGDIPSRQTDREFGEVDHAAPTRGHYIFSGGSYAKIADKPFEECAGYLSRLPKK